MLLDKKKKNLVYISLGTINIILGLSYLYLKNKNKEKMTQKGGRESVVNKNIKTKREKLLEKCGLPDNLVQVIVLMIAPIIHVVN